MILRRCVLPLFAVGIALGIDLLLKSFLNETSLGLFILAAMLSAWYGGVAAGIVSIVAAAFCSFLLYPNPHFSLALSHEEGLERLLVFVTVGLLMSWLTARVKRVEAELKQLNSELEERVAIRTAALQESNRQLEAFSYTLAHDLRAPVRAMQGFAHFLLETNGARLDDEGRDYAERISRSSERMGQLILDLLAYTELVRADLKPEKVELERVMARVLRVCDPEIRQAGGVIEVDPGLPTVCGDAAVLQRVLQQLISNALKFRKPETPAFIRVRAEAAEAEAKTIRIWVEDNGVGIDPKYQDQIFGVFQKLEGFDGQPGTGIGLALVKKGIERMSGRVGVESEPGVGSRFWFELPVACRNGNGGLMEESPASSGG